MRSHSAETRAKISAALLGHTVSPEVRAKIGAANKGRKHSTRGRKHSAEHRAKISAANKGRKLLPHSAEHRAKISAANKGRKHSAEHRAKISAAHKGLKHSAETRAKIGASSRGRTFTAEHRAKIGTTNKMKWTTEMRAKQAVRMAKQRTHLAHPNKAELKLKDLLEKHFRGIFRMNVKDGIIIAGKIPDFVSITPGYIIEMFGRYWHLPEDEPRRIEVFAHLGFRTLVIWEDELSDEPMVVEKIRRFVITSYVRKRQRRR